MEYCKGLKTAKKKIKNKKLHFRISMSKFFDNELVVAQMREN